jgi:hypothetical protein
MTTVRRRDDPGVGCWACRVVGPVKLLRHLGKISDERRAGPGPAAPIPASAAAVQPAFPRGGERAGQFDNKLVEMVAGDPGEDRMGQGGTGRLDRHKSATVRPVTVLIKSTRWITSTDHY